jgi:hypothetical protein
MSANNKTSAATNGIEKRGALARLFFSPYFFHSVRIGGTVALITYFFTVADFGNDNALYDVSFHI